MLRSELRSAPVRSNNSSFRRTMMVRTELEAQENIAHMKKDEMELDYIDDWLLNSPDLNPIENVWKIFKSRVKLHHTASPHELRKAIEDVWKEITVEEVNECILGSKKHPNRHMHPRFQMCVDNNGLSTEN